MLNSFRAVIDAFETETASGPVEIRRILNLSSPAHVYTMRARNLIPPRYWLSIVGEAQSRGGKLSAVTLDLLARLAAERQTVSRLPEEAA